jgi:amidohydrolase
MTMISPRIAKTIIDIRRRIHRHPELGTHEHRTAALVERVLRSAGIPSRRLAGTGVHGVLRGGRSGARGPVIALRADMDALPLQERTGASFASRVPGVMHACGHDANTAVVLGAALVLARERERLAGTVSFIFQPNEESSGGARSMIAAGVLRRPRPGAIVGVHVSPWLAPGMIGLKRGPMMAAVDRFVIEIIGEGTHGAYPHLGRDAVVAAAHAVTALQMLVSRENDPTEPAVLTIGMIAGGERFNIVAGSVRMEGTVRTLNPETRRRFESGMRRVLRGVCAAFGARFILRYEHLGSPLCNDARVVALCARAVSAAPGPSRVRYLDRPSMGGEDFAEYSERVPGCFLYLGTAVSHPYPWHHARFAVNESALPAGAAALAGIARTYCTDSSHEEDTI